MDNEQAHGAADVPAIEPGMLVEATKGDLGEDDISPPAISDVHRDGSGRITKVVVTKGIVFKKEIEVAPDRIEVVEPSKDEGEAAGKVVIAATADEIQALAAAGTETLPPKAKPEEHSDRGLLHAVEITVPTEVGLREMESTALLTHGEQPADTTARGVWLRRARGATALPLKLLGPGFLAGISGKDSSAVTTYAVDGAQIGYGHLWLMLVATPLLQAVQYACAKVGRIQQNGFAEVLRNSCGTGVAATASILLIIANLGMVAANLVAIGSGLELLTGVAWYWFVVPMAVALWYVTVYQDFNSLKKIFLVMSLAFLAYIITALMSSADWGAVLSNTFVPHLEFSLASISGAVALLGATISPYTLFWQVQGEKEEIRTGPRNVQLRTAGVDIATGVISSNLVAYFIIVSSSATLHAHGMQIGSAIDAARALEPLVGPFAKYLFAVGLIGAGLIAIPILLASTSYALTDTIGWPAGLSRKPWQSEGFYLIFTAALVISLVIALLGLDPIQLMFWANALQGVLTPGLIVLLMKVGNDRKVMQGRPFNKATNLGLGVTAVLMFIGAGLLVYSLVAGALA